MIDCTRVPFMPTHAPTGSTSRSRENTATLARSPASRTAPRIDHRAVVDFRNFLLEQLDQQRRVGARQDDLRPLGARGSRP